ncbi:MAG: 30S ribosomal protein S6 [Candidatus Shikimatogenerans sp. AspAUS03]|uniref:Small ribosomal subunit protein bS6 n=1 Tax=Candidatus Shikimatogenerans sp. AspAUS03 TaxID=3158563 RepID=A0AAU7QT80_9FLAO
MKIYECILIFNSMLLEKKILNIIKLYKNYILKKKGKIIYKELWGIKKLSYIIKKQNTGYYYLIQFIYKPKNIKKLKFILKNNDQIIRFLIIKLNKNSLNYYKKKKNINYYKYNKLLLKL